MTQAGEIVAGKYRLLCPLGEGGMGEVWRAEHVQLGHAVAIKLLSVRGPTADGAVKRFLREGQIAAAIRHPNVVRIHDLGEHEGAPYLVMELLRGEALFDRLRMGTPLTVAAFLELVLGVLDGLAAVHAAGIVHRDLKPENIFVVHDPAGDYAKLLDFGISRATEHGRGHTITRDGVIPGTPEYVSPERARGGAQHDPRSDIYSLAVVMYEALAGRRPIQGSNVAELIATLLDSDPVPLEALRADLPAPLTRCVMKAMARRPEDRHANVEQMREELRSVMTTLGDAATLRLGRKSVV